ncbi:MAG: glycoside hydrolase family 15 protein [Actinomycetota bacterium]|nr:glycoside hydrolase family 15 protein [Actinomycetota bacterium]MDQ2958414.1 glycoside hydrolase family 15 protein [Actinomycetota bacterium]
MVGDLHTAAMISRDGSVDWLCLPRFDSPACFAAMLGTEDNGHWSLSPSGEILESSRRYWPDSLILETRFRTASGTALVLDFMPPRDEVADLVRIVRCEQGSVEFATLLRIRCDYGKVIPWVRHVDGGIAAVAGPDAIYVRSEVELTGRDHSTGAEFTVAEGEQVSFVLTRTDSHADEPGRTDPDSALADTEVYWRDWMSGCEYRGRWPEQVHRSLITLKALTFRPTGGIVAAATTSLPEQPEGPRNWDYRYCWLRDSTFTLEALLSCGYTEEATAWRHWLLRSVGGDPAELQVLYTIDGGRRIDESELGWLSGYADSSPVRIGNAAAGQFQLDIFGEVLDTLDLARACGITQHPDPRRQPSDQIDSAWEVQRLLADAVAARWTEPDDGLWEIRAERRHFVHSKVMAWVAFDRMIRGVEKYGLDGPVQSWRQLRDQIHAEVCARGTSEDGTHFVQSYGSAELDAALLLLPRVGFLPWDDPRIVATVHAVRDTLTDEAGFVRRYLAQPDSSTDGLAGGEASFLACSFWMVDALGGIGELAAAERLFEQLLSVTNDLGLIAEEYDKRTGMLWGNLPQAYSHVGLINAARRLEGTGVNR